jgi:photosystem II stability/assembly factor-like uncharacterized protein
MNFYILAFMFLFTISSSLHPDGHPGPKREVAGATKIVFKSAEGGLTWQDISNGLPENFGEDGIRGNGFFANDKGLFLRAGNEVYHSTSTATAPFWTKEQFPVKYRCIATGRSGIVANNYWGVNLKKANGASVWSPIFKNIPEPRMRTVFETTGGAIFIGTNIGLFKTTNSGKTWKHVYAGGLVGHLAESNGVLVSTSMRRIIRSTDNGENWALGISEGDLAFDVKRINGGFAAITSSSETNTRKLRTSCDGGQTWQSIDGDLQHKLVIDSIWRTWNDRPRVPAVVTPIIQVGENYFSAHPDGLFRSTDEGKTWPLLLPSVKGKVFNLFVSGNVIYAIPSKGGC